MPLLGFLIIALWILWITVMFRIAMNVVSPLETLLFFAAIVLVLPGDILTSGGIVMVGYLASKAIKTALWKKAFKVSQKNP